MILDLIELILWAYFFYVVSYTLVFSVAGLFYKVRRNPAKPTSKFAVFIPAYKEDGVILEVARQSLNQNYPATFYRVVIIADSLQPDTIIKLRSMPIEVVEVNFESSTKVKSLAFAISNLQGSYDYAVILDADNVMEPQFLSMLNDLHVGGAKVIQGQRAPKNSNNEMAFLDGISEAINNHVYRQGSTALGLSSSISGSGISFDYPIYKSLITGMTSIGGFDRELELLLLQKGIRVLYYKHAIVYDEKVQKTAVFENQRRRWISSQYHYLAKYFWAGCSQLFKGNISFFNSAVLRNIQLPRLLNLGLLVLITALLFFFRETMSFGYARWPILLALLLFSIAISIPREFYGKDLLRSLFALPGLFVRMFLLLFRLKGANKKFIHTPHGAITEKTK
jgi:cellulose synthase/poly-beta-1,6-N-acetylglucosamine synthase-like glycosyltransferase